MMEKQEAEEFLRSIIVLSIVQSDYETCKMIFSKVRTTCFVLDSSSIRNEDDDERALTASNLPYSPVDRINGFALRSRVSR